MDFLAQDFGAVAAAANDQIRIDELAVRRAFFNAIEKQPLTDEQSTAVVTFDNRVQVIAAAGSGKTSVMVARAAYSICRAGHLARATRGAACHAKDKAVVPGPVTAHLRLGLRSATPPLFLR